MKKISAILIVALLAIFVTTFLNCSKAPTAGNNNAVTNAPGTTASTEFLKRNPPDPQEKLLRRLNSITNRLNRLGGQLDEIIRRITEPKSDGVTFQLNHIRTEANQTIDFCNHQILQLGRGGPPEVLNALNNVIGAANHIIQQVDASLANTGRGFPGDPTRIVKQLEHMAHNISRINHHLEHLFSPPEESEDSFSRDDD